MAERHLWSIRLTQQSERCGKLGCPDVPVYEAIYRFQHEGESRATQRTWFYCKRHGEGWARVHDVVCPDVPEGLTPAPEQTRDEMPPQPTGVGTFRRRRGLV